MAIENASKAIPDQEFTQKIIVKKQSGGKKNNQKGGDGQLIITNAETEALYTSLVQSKEDLDELKYIWLISNLYTNTSLFEDLSPEYDLMSGLTDYISVMNQNIFNPESIVQDNPYAAREQRSTSGKQPLRFVTDNYINGVQVRVLQLSGGEQIAVLYPTLTEPGYFIIGPNGPQPTPIEQDINGNYGFTYNGNFYILYMQNGSFNVSIIGGRRRKNRKIKNRKVKTAKKNKKTKTAKK